MSGRRWALIAGLLAATVVWSVLCVTVWHVPWWAW